MAERFDRAGIGVPPSPLVAIGGPLAECVFQIRGWALYGLVDSTFHGGVECASTGLGLGSCWSEPIRGVNKRACLPLGNQCSSEAAGGAVFLASS